MELLNLMGLSHSQTLFGILQIGIPKQDLGSIKKPDNNDSLSGFNLKHGKYFYLPSFLSLSNDFNCSIASAN